MSTFPAPWALCGGWAVDSWLGRITREHVDIDVAVFLPDQQALFQHLAGWQLVAHDPDFSGETNELWDGRPLGLPGHLHGRLDTGEPLPESLILTKEQGFVLDVQLSDREGQDWVLSDEPRLTLPFEASVRESPWGLPTAVPEVLLFFKAAELRAHDKADFAALLPHLTPGQRDWLREALAAADHPWLAQLSP
jgi:hypothetical protein